MTKVMMFFGKGEINEICVYKNKINKLIVYLFH